MYIWPVIFVVKFPHKVHTNTRTRFQVTHVTSICILTFVWHFKESHLILVKVLNVFLTVYTVNSIDSFVSINFVYVCVCIWSLLECTIRSKFFIESSMTSVVNSYFTWLHWIRGNLDNGKTVRSCRSILSFLIEVFVSHLVTKGMNVGCVNRISRVDSTQGT